jgi:DNA polymerase I
VPERIYLIDGSALVYRAHFAFVRNPRLTSSGRNVSVAFGVAQTLFNVIVGREAHFAMIAFDTAAPTFRHERYGAYKAHRPPMPEELVAQLPDVRALVAAAGIATLAQDGVEADDIIASLAVTLAGQGHEAVIVSADKDFNQLVSDRLTQLVPPRGREPYALLTPAWVKDRWGVDPPQVLDVLSLVGDSVDNVPGVPGIGEKTAIELIKEFGDLDTLYERIESVSRPAVRAKLGAHREGAYLSRELIRLKTDLFPSAAIETYPVPDFRSRSELLDLLQEFEFRRLIETLDLRPGEDDWGARYETIDDERRLREVLANFPGEGAPLAIDTETDSLDARRARPVGISFAWEPGIAYYIPLAQQGAKNIPPEQVCACLRPLLDDEGIEKVGQNLKYDLHVLHTLGLDLKGPIFDTMLAAYLLDPDRPRDLDSMTLDLLGHRKIPTTSLIGSGKQQTTMDLVPVDRVRDYAAEDADAALRLRAVLLPSLRETGQERLLREIEAPLVSVLVAMERAGVFVDVPQLASLGRELEADMERQAEEIYRYAGSRFNINSPAQLGEVLFERLKLPKGRKTKTGYSTDSEVLEDLAAEQPVARAVLEYRQTAKLSSTYVEALPRLVDSSTGRIHAQFNQTVAATGRLSSSDPNLQNIPIRTPQGKRIRRAFIAQRSGEILLSADYSQIELRLLAHLSGDPGLTAAFNAGEDIHRATAARIFEVPPERVDSVMRGRAKTVNFGILYGMGPIRLSRELGIPLAEARRFIEQYFSKMPGVKGYLEESLAAARRDGFVTTLLGRRRYLPGLNAQDARSRAQAERIAANTPIQGSAADLIKKAMVRVHRDLSDRKLASRLILQVHDELLFEGPEGEKKEVERIVRVAMQQAIQIDVPLVVEIGSGRSWDEAHG